jgi:hypothetical protein
MAAHLNGERWSFRGKNFKFVTQAIGAVLLAGSRWARAVGASRRFSG